MPQPSTRRHTQRGRRQEYSDDDIPCTALVDAAFNKALNPSEILQQVRRNLSLISVSDIHYDPACPGPGLTVPLATSSACIHGISRLVKDSKTIRPHILNQVIDLWLRLLPWIMFFFNQVVLRRPELFIDTATESKPDALLTFSRTGTISGLVLSSFMLKLPSILHDSQDMISCVARVWIVSSGHRLVSLSELMPVFFVRDEPLTKILVQTVKQELSVTRVTLVLSRLIRDIDCVDIAWDVIRDDLEMVRVLSEDPSLGLSFCLAKSTPWVCYILSRAVEAPTRFLEEEDGLGQIVITRCINCVQLALLRGPCWIAQALKHTHFLRSLLGCCLIKPSMDLSKILSQVLEVITINLVWRGILRQVRKSFAKMNISMINSPSFPFKLAQSWVTLLEVVEHRWWTRTKLHGDSKEKNLCMNEECKTVDETRKTEAKFYRCSGCGWTFCSLSCRTAASSTHRESCRQERIRRKVRGLSGRRDVTRRTVSALCPTERPATRRRANRETNA
ncbi:hypothetical protein ARMGADRAFT_134241 [Armillaria gallica]|uniref:MYND-type domain-containing protein n=1 Tax=Armillaria gallica TaxID=47427 RepID=A0A2H3CS02_ARMGA|nr:hypothetical protein ARMGADRAFT_134241 [Armillaria gallica]